MSQHTESNQHAPVSDAMSHSPHPAAAAEPWWQLGAHNVQRTMENVAAPIELWHHLHHPAAAGQASSLSALGSEAAAVQSTVASSPALPEYGQLVDSLRPAGPLPKAGGAGAGLRGLGPLLGGLGAVFGGVEAMHGLHALQHGEWLQGTLETLAGFSGIGAGALGLIGASSASVAAPVAAGLGMLAYGDGLSRDWNIHGAGPGQERRSNFEKVGEYASTAYGACDQFFGGGILGKVTGGAAAGLVGLGMAPVAAAANLGIGVVGAGLGAGRFVSRLGESLWHGAVPAAEQRVSA